MTMSELSRDETEETEAQEVVSVPSATGCFLSFFLYELSLTTHCPLTAAGFDLVYSEFKSLLESRIL